MNRTFDKGAESTQQGRDSLQQSTPEQLEIHMQNPRCHNPDAVLGPAQKWTPTDPRPTGEMQTCGIPRRRQRRQAGWLWVGGGVLKDVEGVSRERNHWSAGKVTVKSTYRRATDGALADKGLSSKICKEWAKFNKKETNHPIKKWQKSQAHTWLKMSRWQQGSLRGKRDHCASIRMAKTHSPENTKCWRGWEPERCPAGHGDSQRQCGHFLQTWSCPYPTI